MQISQRLAKGAKSCLGDKRLAVNAPSSRLLGGPAAHERADPDIVSLARAIYSRAATLILDDVISAVDATTSQHIVKHCFQSDLTAGRTIIIASHAVEALAPISHQALFLQDAKVVFCGTGSELLSSPHMAHLVADKFGPDLGTLDDSRDIQPASNPAESSEDVPTFEVKESSPKTPRQLIEDETRGDGALSGAVWFKTLWSCGGVWYWSMLAVMLLAVNLMGLFQGKVLE